MTAPTLESLSATAGLDLSTFRRAHVDARILRALARSGTGDIGQLRQVLAEDPIAREDFRRSIAISVTGIYRDPEQFELLEQHLSPLRRVPRPRVWSAGCSNGAELWTMALLLSRHGLLERSSLLGSDLLSENVDWARRGLDQDRREGHELPTSAPLRFEVRDLVAHAAPPGTWNLVLCRNVAIYFEPEARLRVHAKLAGALAPGGLLLLGRSERLSEPADLGVDRIAPHLYRRVA